MATYEQTDGFVPNKQTPPATSKIGASDALFSEVNATTVSGTTVNAGAINKLGRSVPAYYSEVVDLPVDTVVTVTHNLSNSKPLIQVYASGAGGVIPFGSGAGTVIYAASGSSANAVQVTSNAAAPGSTVVVIG
jgi:hypothetical protein